MIFKLVCIKLNLEIIKIGNKQTSIHEKTKKYVFSN